MTTPLNVVVPMVESIENIETIPDNTLNGKIDDVIPVTPRYTASDKFTRLYDKGMLMLHSTYTFIVLDVIVFLTLILKLIWPALNPFLLQDELDDKLEKLRYLGFLGLLVMCIVPMFLWPITYVHSRLRRYRGIYASIVFHISYTTVNVILLRIFHNPFWITVVMDIPLFIHTIIVFCYHQYNNQISGSNHRSLYVLNGFVTRPAAHISIIIAIVLEYFDTYQGYYTYKTHTDSNPHIRNCYLAFAALNSFLMPLVFSLSATIGSSSSEGYFLRECCWGFFYEVRRTFAQNLLGFITDVPFLVFKIIDYNQLLKLKALNIVIFVFNCLMCIKALTMGLLGVIVVALTGCDNGICDCCQIFYTDPTRCCRDTSFICKSIPSRDCPKASFMGCCCLSCCFSYRIPYCPCLPDWLNEIKENHEIRNEKKMVKRQQKRIQVVPQS
jgi:hypothetical protein